MRSAGIEHFKYLILRIIGYAGSIVRDGDMRHAATFCNRDENIGTLRCVFHGVVDQINQNLTYSLLVGFCLMLAVDVLLG